MSLHRPFVIPKYNLAYLFGRILLFLNIASGFSVLAIFLVGAVLGGMATVLAGGSGPLAVRITHHRLRNS